MAAHRHPGKRHGGQARWGTGLTGVVVAVIATCGMAWATGPVPRVIGGGTALDHVGPGATVAITAGHVHDMRGIYPGGSGAVVVSITNRNDVAVRITAVDLPADMAYATGYTTSAHTTRRTGCSASTSGVVWTGSQRGRSSQQPLATPLVIPAHQAATVTMDHAAQMNVSAPAACEATYFAMPAVIGIGTRSDAHARTSMPAVDSWGR